MKVRMAQRHWASSYFQGNRRPSIEMSSGSIWVFRVAQLVGMRSSTARCL